jgi:hypothetical protein
MVKKEKSELEVTAVTNPTHDMILGMDWLEKKTSSLALKSGEIKKECNNLDLRKDKIKTLLKKAYGPLNQEVLQPHPEEYDCAINLIDDQTYKKPRLYPISKEEDSVLKEFLDVNLREGQIHQSKSSFVSPILFVGKPDETPRLCVDYWALNMKTKKDCYCLLLMKDVVARIKGSRMFTKLDVRSAFNQTRI